MNDENISNDEKNNLPLISEQKTKTAPKKKIKDIIKLDINIFSSQSNNLDNNIGNIDNKPTIFSKNLNFQKNIDKELDLKTGLPKIFKTTEILEQPYNLLANYPENKSNLDIIENNQMNSNTENKLDKIKISEIKNNEYKNIHNKNLELITNMSKEELFNNIQTIKSNIPNELLEKMKSGFFQKKLSNYSKDFTQNNQFSLNEEINFESKKIILDNDIQSDEVEEEEKNEIDLSKNQTEIKNANDLQIKLNEKKEKSILVFDFDGEVKYISEEEFY